MIWGRRATGTRKRRLALEWRNRNGRFMKWECLRGRKMALYKTPAASQCFIWSSIIHSLHYRSGVRQITIFGTHGTRRCQYLRSTFLIAERSCSIFPLKSFVYYSAALHRVEHSRRFIISFANALCLRLSLFARAVFSQHNQNESFIDQRRVIF